MNHCNNVYLVVQFCPWFQFYFLLYLGMVMSDTEFQTKESKILTKDKIEPQHYIIGDGEFSYCSIPSLR